MNKYNFSKNYKYLIALKDFYFQLIYENVEYTLLLFFLFIKKIMCNSNNTSGYIEKKDMIKVNFIYRKYTLESWLNYRYYDDLFDTLSTFEKGVYSDKLSR
jgi:hypothetical protein